MEGIESTTRERTTTKDGNQDADNKVLMSSKPLHRFVSKQPRALGVVIVIFGCAELLVGFQLSSEVIRNSSMIYIPFWQGALFLVCGNLSIYTEIHPSKKMVTVCLSMYVVSLLGMVISLGYRIACIDRYTDTTLWPHHYEDPWEIDRVEQILGVEIVLLLSSLCVTVLLIFLSAIARLALKSTHTQVIIQRIPAPQRDTASN
ncbi:membrane-spanning 4-domains subfamily A member 4D-like [Notolabrus celidotus]|uniref:membrane-spanning 4-domains subfamily A member 4D-like n=1 Tax=Notolabrus celidotus TaxID=1203425 RepID=UPI00148FB176|nr:membrane-spanning 4-domains subfamily A member 4D-like [Notolabrus celidotus]